MGGGMQALEWALEVRRPMVRSIASFSASGRHQPWQIGISECQRQAIYADPDWQGGHYHPEKPPAAGLGVARMMAMLTYRSQPGYWTKFSRSVTSSPKADPGLLDQTFNVESYLHAQGKR